MALYHAYSEVENSNTGVPMVGVRVVPVFRNTGVPGAGFPAPIFADQAGTPFVPSGYCVTDSTGMYSFYIEPGEYDLDFFIGSEFIRRISDFRPAEVGPAGPTGAANSTYETTVALEGADTTNVSAILSEPGKQGTFTTRPYADFIAQVAADTDKINYIRSGIDGNLVWVRAASSERDNISLTEAVAAVPLSMTFTSFDVTVENPNGERRQYVRTLAPPGYALTADQPVSKNALAAPTGASSVGRLSPAPGSTASDAAIRLNSMPLSVKTDMAASGTFDEAGAKLAAMRDYFISQSHDIAGRTSPKSLITQRLDAGAYRVSVSEALMRSTALQKVEGHRIQGDGPGYTELFFDPQDGGSRIMYYNRARQGIHLSGFTVTSDNNLNKFFYSLAENAQGRTPQDFTFEYINFGGAWGDIFSATGDGNNSEWSFKHCRVGGPGNTADLSIGSFLHFPVAASNQQVNVLFDENFLWMTADDNNQKGVWMERGGSLHLRSNDWSGWLAGTQVLVDNPGTSQFNMDVSGHRAELKTWRATFARINVSGGVVAFRDSNFAVNAPAVPDGDNPSASVLAVSVDTGTGIITHGFTDLFLGAGVRLTGGIGGVVNGNVYFAIPVTTGTCRIASTWANAQAGTSITLSSSGTSPTMQRAQIFLDMTCLAGPNLTIDNCDIQGASVFNLRNTESRRSKQPIRVTNSRLFQWFDIFSPDCPAFSFGGGTSALGGVAQVLVENCTGNQTPITSAQWAANTSYAVGNRMRLGLSENICTAAGTSGATAPVAIKGVFTDGTATWRFIRNEPQCYVNDCVLNAHRTPNAQGVKRHVVYLTNADGNFPPSTEAVEAIIPPNVQIVEAGLFVPPFSATPALGINSGNPLTLKIITDSGDALVDNSASVTAASAGLDLHPTMRYNTLNDVRRRCVKLVATGSSPQATGVRGARAYIIYEG